jgi:hypothetical protein
MNAVRKRFITGPKQSTMYDIDAEISNQKYVNAMATARGHLDRTRMGQPHANSQSISTLWRFHSRSLAIHWRFETILLESDCNISRNDSRTFQYQVGTQKSHPTHGLHGPATNSLYPQAFNTFRLHVGVAISTFNR